MASPDDWGFFPAKNGSKLGRFEGALDKEGNQSVISVCN